MLRAMTQGRPYPDFWYAIAGLLSALRKLLRAARPEAFGAFALDARAQLAAITALVRRYLHVLAADIHLPPPRPHAPSADNAAAGSGSAAKAYRFPLFEKASAGAGAGSGEDPHGVQYALLLQAADRLVAVLANPAPHARRLARGLQRAAWPVLRELPVPWHILRRIGPAIDNLLMDLDRAARPQAWRGIEADSS